MEMKVTLSALKVEILVYKNQTAQNIVEIGKRLIQAKEQLPHGEFGKWVEDEVQFSYQTANRFMKVATEMPNLSALRGLEPTKIFALLSLPEEQRNEIIEEKPVDKMTTRELDKAIKEKKEAIQRAEYAEQRAKEVMNELHEARAQKDKPAPEPKIINREVIKEVYPKDYDTAKQEAETQKKRAEDMRRIAVAHEGKLKAKEKENESLRVELESKNLEKDGKEINILRIIGSCADFVKQNSSLIYQGETLKQLDNRDREQCLRALRNLDDFVFELKNVIESSTNYVEVQTYE